MDVHRSGARAGFGKSARTWVAALIPALVWAAGAPAANAANETSFSPRVPARLADTREGGSTVDGLFAGGGKVPAGGVLEVTVAGRNGVPADAKAVALNVTVTQPEAAGYVTVWACGAARPNASNLNYAAGQTVANAAFAEFGDAGKVCFFTEQTTHLIVDVNGAFPATSSFTPTSPSRFADTRSGSATVDGMFAGGGKVPAGGVLQVDVGGRHGVPVDAEAVAVNVTVAEPDAAGYATVWACGDPRPNASNLNYAAGQTVANAAFAELGDGGKVCVYSERATHLIVDVNGVFPAESSFSPWWPARLVDTRAGGMTVDGKFAGGGMIPAGGVLELPIAGRNGVPDDAEAVALNVTVAEPQAAGYITVWPCGFARPNASNLNYAVGQTVANAVFAQFGDAGRVCFYTEQATQLIVDLNGVFGDTTPSAPAPAITSIEPTAGPASGGTTVTITGTGFTGATAVTFAGTPADSFTVDSATQITAITPSGLGAVDVVVTTIGGSATDIGGFTYLSPLAIFTVSPTAGPQAGGTTVTITGLGFSATTGVSFGGVPATSFAVDSATQITAVTPAGVGAADVTVSRPGGSATAAGAYTYVPAPTIAAVAPNAGPQVGGTAVTITGTNFSGATAVAFGGTPAAGFLVISPTQIFATTPAGVGAVDVAVTTVGGSATATGAFTYAAVPSITAVAPSIGPEIGGTSVVITGSGFGGTTSVTFGGVPASFAVDSATQITASTPPGSGTVDVVVTTPGGSATVTGAYTYVAAPTIISLSPSSGPTSAGEPVTITGGNLTGTTSVTFGGTPAVTFTVVSPAVIIAVAPAGSGTVDVVVTTPGGSATAAGAYTYVAAPTIIAVSPTTGPEAGGLPVTITGTGLSGTTSVTFGGVPALFTVDSPTQITAYTPAGTGMVDVTVTSLGGSATATGAHTYLPAPTITTITPTSGPEAGGTSVTITGTGFSGTTSVTFAGVPASFTVVSATQITAVTPAGSGLVDVTVTSLGGSSTAVEAYLYVPAPVIFTVSPSTGPEAGGLPVTITGSEVTGTTAVAFGGVPASFTVISPTQIEATIPAGTGTVDVVVTTPGGSAVATGAYTYVATPTIIAVSPTVGPESGGNTVAITGTDLTTTSLVSFGGVLASFTVDSPTQISAIAPAGFGTVDITVFTAGGFVTAAGAYTYVPSPAVLALIPTAGSEAGGTTVTILGSGLIGASSVMFGEVPASFTVDSPAQITAIAPAGTGTVDVVVTTPGGSAAITGAYTYVPAPTIGAISPTVGPDAGGNTVTVTGTDLMTTTEVIFGGAPASFTVVSPTQIAVIAPAGTGVADITVTTVGGSATVTGAYTYVPSPAIFELSPTNGPDTGGTPLTITGIAFTTTTSVTIDAIEVPFTVVDDTQITVTTPAHAPGSVDVTVTTAAGSSTVADGFMYIPGV